MKSKAASALLAGLALGANPAAASATPNEVKVGILDVQADSVLCSAKGVAIDYRRYTQPGKTPAQWLTESGFDHGQLVATAFVEQVRKINKSVPIRIFSANVFEETQAATVAAYESAKPSKRTLTVNWDGAREALKWFKENGVKIVLTSFTGQDSPAQRAFMNEASAKGMVVFASAGNAVGAPAYPARYPETISVAGDNKELSFRKDPTMATWVHFSMNGLAPGQSDGPQSDKGSSFAVARAAAFGSYYAAFNASSDRDGIVQALRSASIAQRYEIGGATVEMARLDESASSKIMAALAIAPTSPDRSEPEPAREASASQALRSAAATQAYSTFAAGR